MPRDGVLLLLDRDGTLIPDVGYPNDPAAVRLLPGAADAIRELVAHGFVPAVVSNQSGIARGRITAEQAAAVHERFVELFEAESGVRLPCFYCPHGPDDDCDCRKPKPGLLQQAVKTLDMIGQPTVMIGDKPADVAAGRTVNAVSVWLAHGRTYPASEPQPNFIANDWPEIVAYLLRTEAWNVTG